jgi:Flp pilus assembly protein TadD
MHRKLLATAALSLLAAAGGGCANLSALNAGTTPAGTAAANRTTTAKPGATASAQAVAQTGVEAPSTNLEEQIQRAQLLRSQGDIAGAVRAFAQLVLIAPDDGRVVGEYGKSLLQQGRPDDAIAFLKRATQLKQDDSTFYSALGVAYDQKDDRKDAAASYDRALALHPGDANVLNNYAVSRMLAGDLDGAQKLLMQAQASGSNNPKVASNLQLLAQMRASKAAGPKAAVAVNGVPAGGTAGTSAPRTLVMQPAPGDAHAATPGHTKPTHKITASTAKSSKTTKTVAKTSAPPTLRTADQDE